MYVRLAFAVAAHLEPEILIVDEVLAVGDAAVPEEVPGQDGGRCAGQGRTVLFVSHNMGAVRALCSSCVYLVNGAVAAQGEVDSIIGQYMKPAEETVRPTVTSRYGIELYAAGLFQGDSDEPSRLVYFLQPCEIRKQ